MTSNEEAQLSQTIEMFEVITQSQPLDYQSLEILKEAYSKLGRQKEAVRTSKRIAEAYVHLGQLSSAILEYEGILQQFPDDPDVRRALAEIELKASNLSVPRPSYPTEERPSAQPPLTFRKGDVPQNDKKTPIFVEDGRKILRDLFVEGKLMSEADFHACWPTVDPHTTPKHPIEPFIQVIAERQLVPVETSLKLLAEKARVCFLPLERCDVDMELARSFPREICQRWCVLPFDRMSKSILVATANPFNKQAVRELEGCMHSRFVWYLASPFEIYKLLRKVFR